MKGTERYAWQKVISDLVADAFLFQNDILTANDGTIQKWEGRGRDDFQKL